MAAREINLDPESEQSMSSTHSPACDHCRAKKQRCERQRPICSNCMRLGLPCEYSGRGKKPNQSTEIIRRLGGAEARIHDLETTLFRILPYIDKFESESGLLNGGRLTGEHISLVGSIQHDQISDFLPSATAPYRPTLEGEWGFASVAKQLGQIASGSLHGEDRLVEPLNTLHHSLNKAFEVQEWLPDGGNSSVKVSKPPLSILQAMATIYFGNVNDYFPIFSRSNIEEKIRMYNNTADDLQDPALSLCFNNMILLALMATSRARLAEEIPISMELSLLKIFWDNAMGAFNSPLHLTLVNVQALLSLSMCLVKMARSCLQLAQTVCKLMDMQADPLQKQQEPVVDEERIDVSWCMSILENSISFPSPGQSFYPLQIPLPVEQPESPAKSHFIANIRLAQLRENIRVTLFGSSTNDCLGTATQTLAFRYLDEIQKIQASLGVDVSLANLACLSMNPFQLSIQYSILTTRLIVHELLPSDLNSAESLADAQNAVRILIAMGGKTIDEVKSHAILPRLFVTDSLVALSALASSVIRDPSRIEDAELLWSIYHLLQRMNKVCAESTFSSALEAILGAVLDFVTAVGRTATSMGSDCTSGFADGSDEFFLSDMGSTSFMDSFLSEINK